MTPVPEARRLASWRRIALWIAIAASFWGVARVTERHTRLEVFSTGSRLEATADGSSISAPRTIESVHRIEIVATASPFPPGGRAVEVRQGSRSLFVDPLPSHFRLPPGNAPPVGDWEIDDEAGTGIGYAREVDIEGAFELVATFVGRPHQHLVVRLLGSPSTAVSFRRGLINNDLFLWDSQWRPLAVTSIDPEPLADVLAAMSILLDAAAAAALIIVLFLIVVRFSPDRAVAGRDRPEGWIAAAAAAVILALAAGWTSLWFADQVLERLPHLPDSVVYLLQARWLTEGRLVEAASAIQSHLDIPFTYVASGRWVAHYPPGWPLLLALGLRLGAPWAVAPVLGACYVLLVWQLGRTVYDRTTGLAAAALAALSPMARLIFGCSLSHAASSTGLVLAVLLAAVARRRASTLAAAFCGLVLGLVLGIRPVASVAVAAPLVILLVSDLRSSDRSGVAGRLLAAATMGAAAGALPVALTNLTITGNPMAFPYSLARGSMYGLANVPFGIQNLDAILASTVPAVFGWGWGSSWVWVFQALPLAFAWVPFLLRRTFRWDLVLGGVVLCLAAIHLGTKAHGLHGFGPRYYFDGFFALYLLTARGFRELARAGAEPGSRPGSRPTTGIVTAAVAAALLLGLCVPAALSLPARLSLYRGYNDVDGSLERAVAEAGVERAVIVFGDDHWQDWAMASRFMTGQLDADLVFARALADNAALATAYPDRPWYLWRDGRLEKVAGPKAGVRPKR